MRLRRRGLHALGWNASSAACAVLVWIASAAGARAQVEANASGSTSIAGRAGSGASELDRWWIGPYWRHQWVPGYATDLFLKRAPSISNDGFGLSAQYRTDGALNLVVGIGYMPFSASGPVLADGQPQTDTELIDSDVKYLHLTSSLLWDVEFHPVIALAMGVGIDFGFFFGKVVRNEAYLDPASGEYRGCEGPGRPDFASNGVMYCNDVDVTTDTGAEGEHYDIEQELPPVWPFLMLPHVALRIQPWDYLTIKGEFAFGIVQLWAGVTLQMSLGIFDQGPREVVAAPEPEKPKVGRVLGVVKDAETSAPVAGATIRLSARALSALASEQDGRFVVDRLDPGLVRFDIEHPEYDRGSCEVEVGKAGGDVPVECGLRPRARVGAISGKVQGEDGAPIIGAAIEVTGPRNETIGSDENGLFAAVDLPAGTYRLRVVTEDYLVQMVEVDVQPHDTAMPHVILLKKPKRSVVELRKQEIVITEQIQFKSNSAEILPGSENVLRQVADALLRNPQIELVEVQGHTDKTGTRDRNLVLSQSRAEAVRDWLVRAGVTSERLEPKGYGPDSPIRSNDTAANRAKNRRVQFIIRRQAD